MSWRLRLGGRCGRDGRDGCGPQCRSVSVVAACFCRGRRPGCAPGGAPTFFCVAKRRWAKKRRPPVCVPRTPCRANGGSLRCSELGWASLNSLRSSSSAQTAATSQMTKCMCPSAHAPTPAPALLGAASRGGERGPNGCCCAAAPGVGSRCALPTVGHEGPAQAERSEGTPGRAKQWPVWSPFPPPSDRAEKRRAWGERVPKDTRLVI